MKKTLLVLFILAIASYNASLAADYVDYSQAFISKFSTCTPYQESSSRLIGNTKTTFTKQVLGVKNGKCHYRNIQGDANSRLIIYCQLNQAQHTELAKAMKATTNSSIQMKQPGLDVTYNSSAIDVAWTKYINTPSVCSMNVHK